MILLTGASGFIGSYLLKKLIAVYGSDQVIALTSKPISGIHCILHNDYAFEDDFFKKEHLLSINTVIHAGAFTPKNGAQANEWVNCDSNIINTHNLLKALPDYVSNFIFLSTLDIYGDTDIVTEYSPVKPISLYGHSKFYCEQMVEKWGRDNKITYQILRIGHVYGPGEEQYQKIIPNTIKRILSNSQIQITGSGNDIRSFIYIEDVIEAIISSLKLASYDGPINIVGAESISIKDLVINLQKIAGDVSDIDYIPSDKPVRNLYFDNSKMKRLLHEEKYRLQTGLKVEWDYMSNIK